MTFRTLDVGGDKVLLYLRTAEEQNPAMGWRAIRLGLDRPGLLRMQIRALVQAAAGHTLRLMLPMITEVEEVRRTRAMVEREVAHLKRHGYPSRQRCVSAPWSRFRPAVAASRVGTGHGFRVGRFQ